MFTIHDILYAPKSPLEGLVRHAARLEKLTIKLRTLLPEYVAKHCLVASWENEKVIIHAAHAAAGTMLRYQLPKILTLLHTEKEYQSIQQLICHIRPPFTANFTSEPQAD